MKSAIGLIALCISFSGCVSTPKEEAYQTKLVQSWVGKNSSELWKALGPPDDIKKLPDGTEYHSYTSRAVATGMSTYLGYGVAVSSASSKSCESYFVIENGTGQITAADWRGDNCQLVDPKDLSKISVPM